jgi:predicted CopG family antitoxin
MTHTIDIDDDLWERIQDHREEGESPEEFLEELVTMYETEGAFLQEGYSE